MARKKARKKATKRRWVWRILLAVVVVVLVGSIWLARPFWQLAGQFADRPEQQPSRIYGAAQALSVGDEGSPWRLRRQLEGRGYTSSLGGPPAPGQFRALETGLDIRVPRTPQPGGWREPGLAEVRYFAGAISSLTWEGERMTGLALEAPLVGAIYGPDRRERRPVRLEDLPEYLTRAVLAAEDARFFSHGGVSARGMLRALWVNVRAGGVRQGGSTLTQQLVKNLFLTHERTISRKLREVVLAVAIDRRYSKPAILNAYLNEIYWGEWGGVNVMGVGAAAHAYFGKVASRLTLCEATVLAGMIQSPGTYDPGRYPERAVERRNWVLGRMHEQGWIDADELARASAEPLCYSAATPPRRSADYFREAARAEASRRFGVGELADAGYTLLTTLRPDDQAVAEEAVAWGVKALEEGWEKDRPSPEPLQAALVSIDPASGAIIAYVGGRDYKSSQFDRARLARRQAGSAFKPVVYATAFEQGVTLPSELLLDEELRVEVAGSPAWEPQNDDKRFRGQVTARRALESSLNVPTARLALDTGLDEVASMASRLGLDRRLKVVPSMALGALEVTPLELATIYATLAAGGVRHSPYFVAGVLDRDGKPVIGSPLPEARPALSPESAYLVTSVLEGVFDRGTARVVREWGMVDPLAGKTGTTNDRRDSWFAGFSPDRATLVWVGYDDNTPTRLSGSRAALPIWNRFVWRRRPAGGYRAATRPPGITTATIDPLSGQLATSRCPDLVIEVFPLSGVPSRICFLHATRRELRFEAAREGEQEEEKRFKRWFSRVFKRKPKDSSPPVR